MKQLFIDNHMRQNISNSYTRNSCLLPITWDQTSVTVVYWQSHGTEHQ